MPWPLDNRSQDLHIDLHYLRRIVGFYLDLGYDREQWDDEQREAVDEMVDEGCRQYYYPPQLTQPWAYTTEHVHEWSWMRPTWEFDTAAEQRRYELPPDFERFIGQISFRDNDGDYYGPLEITSAGRLRALENRQNYKSVPAIAAVEPKAMVGNNPQGQVLALHPTPDAVYRLQAQYQAIARRLTEEQPYPLGGQIHGPGILASCLAVAEFRKLGAQGPAWQKFMTTLASNIIRDQSRGADILGYNGNARTEVWGRGTARRIGGVFYRDATYGGNLYSG